MVTMSPKILISGNNIEVTEDENSNENDDLGEDAFVVLFG